MSIFKNFMAEYTWAADLQALAKPIPLDDATAYTEVFDVGAEGERTHVQNQLAVIYEYLDITPADDHFARVESTSDLKYELVFPIEFTMSSLSAVAIRIHWRRSCFEATPRLQASRHRMPWIACRAHIASRTSSVFFLSWV